MPPQFKTKCSITEYLQRKYKFRSFRKGYKAGVRTKVIPYLTILFKNQTDYYKTLPTQISVNQK